MTKKAISARTVAAAIAAIAIPAAVTTACRADAEQFGPLAPGVAPQTSQSAMTVTSGHIAVVFSGGHETDSRDRGRPVDLVAGALGVPDQVFRETFTHVHPAQNGVGPTPEEARQNKAALMAGLSPYGITNDRLDAVSNYYRYVRSRGIIWPTRPASAYAVVEKGMITSFVVTDGGSGYSSAPAVTVPGFITSESTVQLSFSKSFERNGAVAAVSLK